MKVKLYEAKWLHRISGDGLYKAIEDAKNSVDDIHEDMESDKLELVKNAAIDLLNNCKEFFDSEDQEYVIYDIDELIDSFEDADEDGDELDMLLAELYDFCDGYNIFLETSSEDDDDLELVQAEIPEDEDEVIVFGDDEEESEEE